MKLETASGGRMKNPTEADIDAALAELEEPDGFLILSHADQEYVQASANVLEYRYAGRHYRFVSTQTRHDLVREVFVSYLHGRDDWRTRVKWEDVTAELGHWSSGYEHLRRRDPPDYWKTIYQVLFVLLLMLIMMWRIVCSVGIIVSIA